MKCLGLIPARLGSERIPRKNMIDLGGKPLIEWTINTAVESSAFDALVVSTDSAEILEVAKHNGCGTILRPSSLAQSDTPMIDVLRHACELFPADVLVLLQPTSPFRSAEDIVLSKKLLADSGGDSVISVGTPPPDFCFERGHAHRLRPAQNIVIANGALYLITREHLSLGDWYSGLNYAYEMPPERSIDIDTQMDLTIARALVKNAKTG